ncbi:hypothetical protein ACJQWY_01285 [Weissella kandleri]|uniref:hypothetical protein n=1 Tax=Weissella kandleri TaxID=1616 RepID=UPI00387EA3A1
MNNWQKIKIISVIGISVFVLAYQIFCMIQGKSYDMMTISGIFATFFFIISFSYNNILFIFSWLNKIILKVKRPTITWSTNYMFYTDDQDDISIKEFQHKMIESIKKIYGDDSSFTLEPRSSSLTVVMTQPENRKFILDIEKEPLDDNPMRVNLNINSTISYNDTNIEIENNELIYSDIKNTLRSMSNENDDYTEYGKPIRSLNVVFKDRNPFYGVMLKRIDSTEIKDFRLEIENDNCIIIIKKHCLSIDNAKDMATFNKIVKGLLSVSDVK